MKADDSGEAYEKRRREIQKMEEAAQAKIYQAQLQLQQKALQMEQEHREANAQRERAAAAMRQHLEQQAKEKLILERKLQAGDAALTRARHGLICT